MRKRSLLSAFAVFVAAAVCVLAAGLVWMGTRSSATQGGPSQPPAAVGQHDYLGYVSLSQLTADSEIVAQVRIVRQLRSYNLPLDKPVTNNAPVLRLGPAGATKAAIAATPAPATPDPASQDVGPPQVDYLVKDVVPAKGANARPGNDLVVTQDGSPPASVVGQQEVMFLRPNLLYPSKYVLTGGPQGRFLLTSGQSVVAVAPETPVGKRYNHSSARYLLTAVRAVAAKT